jgi:hypothetical protein
MDLSGGARPEWVYGGGHLWIYDVGTSLGIPGESGTSASVVEISVSTGAIERTVPMPNLYRPILVTNEDGLWAVGSDQATALWHVSPSSRFASGIPLPARSSVRWLTAWDHRVWVDTYANEPTFRVAQGRLIESFPGEISSYVGTGARLSFRRFDVAGETSPIGNDSVGLWTITSTPVPEVIRLDPQSGTHLTTSKLAPLTNLTNFGTDSLGPGEAVIFDGALYILQSVPTEPTTYGSLIRIPLD